MINTNESIDYLNKKLLLAKKIDESGLAEQLIDVGFECMRCGECCQSKSGDNSVIVFPDEIFKITKAFSLKWNDVCKPSTPQFIDGEGILHAFEWELKRNENGNCCFLIEHNTCKIYGERPWICCTYPFYLVFEGSVSVLRISDCQGIGLSIKKNRAIKLAFSLKERLIEEIREEILLLKNLEEHHNWNLIKDYPELKFRDRPGIVVHDGLGSHMC